ncbi:hypothetical protein [Paenibacillus kribbensis]|nr:hypothetical protein [Paenibacillus kribbensis]
MDIMVGETIYLQAGSSSMVMDARRIFVHPELSWMDLRNILFSYRI